MMNPEEVSEIFSRPSGWLVAGVSVAVLVVVAELAFRLGRHHTTTSKSSDGPPADQTGMMAGALLGLLGLLLAFSFGIAEARFSKRKSLVLEEANAIGTTYLRAATLPAPHDERIEELLWQYVNLRLEVRDPARIADVIRRSEALQGRLWDEAAELARAHPDSEVVAIFLLSLNEMIDLHESRVTVVFYQRLPPVIVWTLRLIAVLAVGILGYGAGLARHRALVPAAALIFSLVAVEALITSLDRPGSHYFRVSQAAMQDARDQIASDREGASPSVAALNQGTVDPAGR